MRKINDCECCIPINELLDVLEENDYKIIEQKISDYHFHELYFKLKGKKKLKGILIKGISNPKKNIYTCDCHWSIVEVFNK